MVFFYIKKTKGVFIALTHCICLLVTRMELASGAGMQLCSCSCTPYLPTNLIRSQFISESKAGRCWPAAADSDRIRLRGQRGNASLK